MLDEWETDVFKLYAVEVTYTLYVLVRDEREAEILAEASAGENEGPDCVIAHEVRDIDKVPEEWKDAIPYGEEEDRTVRQILQPFPEPEKPYDDPNQLKLPM